MNRLISFVFLLSILHACNYPPNKETGKPGVKEVRLNQFQIRAFENALVTAMANYANTGLNSFNGHSCVFGADREQKLLAGENEGVYVAEINLGRMREIREKTIYGNAYWRPHKFELLTSSEVEKPFERKNTLGQPFKRLER